MPRTPDRFEKTVRRAARKDEWGMLVLDSNEVIDLLRAEHRWFRDRINEHRRSINAFSDKELDERFKAGYSQACAEMLNLLTQRRK